MTFNTLIFGLLVFLGNIYHLNTKNSNFGLLVSNTKKRVVLATRLIKTDIKKTKNQGNP